MSKAPAKAPAKPQTPAAPPAQLLRLGIHELQVNPANPRKHSDEQISRLAAALTLDGQTKPVLARAANRMLIAGHGVTLAAKSLGWLDLAVLLLDVDQATADRIMLSDNRLSDLSTTDQARVSALLQGIDPADYFATGFSPEEVGKILAGAEEELELRELDVSEVADEFWVSVRGPLTDQAGALQQLKAVLAEYPNLKIELGVISLS